MSRRIDRTLRVCFDGRYIADRYPGIGRYAFELCRALVEHSDLELVLLSNERAINHRFDLDQLARSRPNLEIVTTDRDPRSFANRCLGAAFVRQQHADLYHSPFFLTPAGDCGRRVVSVHDLLPIQHPETITNPMVRWLTPLLVARAIRSADVVLVPSRATATALQDWIDSRTSKAVEVRIVPLGVRGDVFRPCSDVAIASLRERLKLPERYVVSVGSWRPHKHLDQLESAWREHRRSQRSQLGLVIVGGGPRPPRSEPETCFRRLRSVREEDLPALYSGAEVCVVPSAAEGFGLPVLEAMACGVAVVCSDGGALPEVAGGAAMVFSAGVVTELVDCLAKVSSSAERRRRMAAAGRARAAEFSWQRCAQSTISAYREVFDR